MLNVLKKFLVVVIFALFAFPTAAFAHGGDEEFRAELDEDNEFEVRGMVTEVGDNFFTVFGFDDPIVLDPAAVEEFEIEGTLAVDADVEAEGIISDGTFFAEEVKVDEPDVDEDVEDVEDEEDED